MQKYYTSSRYKLLYSLIGLLVLIPVIVLSYRLWRVPVFNYVLFLLITLVIIRAVYWIRNENIAISNSGLEYDTPGIILEIKWENIQKVSHVWKWFIRQECLVADQAHVKIKRWAIYANSYPSLLENYPQNIAIPLSCFSENWRDSELGQQIKQYAPHLFEKEKSA
jgi:hypothetical protein